MTQRYCDFCDIVEYKLKHAKHEETDDLECKGCGAIFNYPEVRSYLNAHNRKYYQGYCPDCCKKIGEQRQGGRKGSKKSEEWKQRQSSNMKGSKNPNWKGGIKFDPYCHLFNEEFKERVRQFWGRKCGLCGKSESENKNRLSVHHVNYDKQSCCNENKPLFIPLCGSCHSKTNYNREYWETSFLNYIMVWFDGQSYMGVDP